MRRDRFQEKSFSVSMYEPSGDPILRRLLSSRQDDQRRERAKKPHEYINGGIFCQLCGLMDKAPIHVPSQS